MRKDLTFQETKVRNSQTARDANSAIILPRLDPRAAAKDLPKEFGGVQGPEPTRFGDWEHKGRCTDF
ncbi:MAG: DUF1674 domain-containing protein [Rhodospirillaceae bacterium]|nr:DUF1674 domain-containing protein [Rhodospirillaceae bacterium]